MSMIWDSPLSATVARELDAHLSGARLRGHRFAWDSREMTLFFRSCTLLWRLHPRRGQFSLGPPQEPPEDSRPLAAELKRVEAPPDERIVRFSFQKVRGQVRSVKVVVELMTNQWNALLLEGEEEWIRHLLWTRQTEGRSLVVGRAYRPPPPSTRTGADTHLSKHQWRTLVSSPDGNEDRQAILDTLAFTSPLNLDSVLGQGRESEAEDETGEPDFAFWKQLRQLDPTRPCILETKRGRQPYPFVLNGFRYSEFSSLIAAFNEVEEEGTQGNDVPSSVSERLEKALHQAKGKARGLEREMRDAARPEELREKANLLLARLREIQKGSTQVVMKGFRGEDVTLDLDPSLSPHENAEALFEEASRMERASLRLPPLLKKANVRIERLERLRDRLISGEATEEEVGELLTPSGEKKRWKGVGRGPRIPYRRFKSSGGMEIRVGRGSGDNDTLTFRHSHPEDIWLHARGASGAHVILRWRKPEPPPKRDLTEAAVLAALHSGARSANVVPVDWTRRKYVRKPRKGRPGTVLTDRTETIFVETDPDLIDRLRWGD